jgi:DnaB helicase-like protein
LIDQSIERPLPQNLDAERSVLGAVVLDNHALSVAVEQVNGEDFFLPQNRVIFGCMVQLAEKQEPIDPITLMEHLERLGQLGAAGGAAYLSQLADGQPRVTNVEYYARIVKEKAVMRRLINSISVIQEYAFDSKDGAQGLVSRAAALFSQVDTGTPRWRDMFHSVAEFENAEPLTFSIRNFLQNNGATLIGGLSGHGKTLILLSIAGAQLRGKGSLLWNHFEVLETAERVIYLIPECSIEPFKHRLELFGLFPFVRDGRLLVRTLSKGPTPCLSDPRILTAAKGAHIILDTAVRFSDGEENSSGDNQRGLATDIFALLGAGARQVLGAHHSPKPFAKETVMTLENVLRGSGDIGAMLSTAWGIKQIDAEQNIIHIENIKPRDFLPPGPFQLIGRPFINDSGDFRMHKRPNECGSLADEHQPDRDKGGAPVHARESRAANLQLLREWLGQNPKQTSEELVARFKAAGVELHDATVRKYRTEIAKRDRQ